MAPIDTNTKKKSAKKEKKTKNYNFDLRSKLSDGKPWKYLTAFDNDVALKILEAVESNPNGGEYIKVINNTMRKGFKLKAKK